MKVPSAIGCRSRWGRGDGRDSGCGLAHARRATRQVGGSFRSRISPQALALPRAPSLRSWGSPQALGFPAAPSPLSTRITPRCVGAGRLHCHVGREAAPVRAEPQGSGAPMQPCPGLGGKQGVREGAVWGIGVSCGLSSQ